MPSPPSQVPLHQSYVGIRQARTVCGSNAAARSAGLQQAGAVRRAAGGRLRAHAHPLHPVQQVPRLRAEERHAAVMTVADANSDLRHGMGARDSHVQLRNRSVLLVLDSARAFRPSTLRRLHSLHNIVAEYHSRSFTI